MIKHLCQIAVVIMALVASAHATTYTVTSSQSTTAIQSVINGTAAGDTVSFAAGLFNITTTLTLRCGVIYTGPVVALNADGTATATARLSASGNFYLFALYSSVAGGNPCSQTTVINFLNFLNGSGINVQTPFTNLLIQYNQFTSIQGQKTQTGALFFASASGANNSNAVLTNTTVTHNQIGDSNSCISPVNVMADTHSPEDYEGACVGLDFFTSINGLTLTYNKFNHVAEGVHIDCPNYANQQYACEPPGGAITQNITAEYNDFYQIHRIPWEEQAQQTAGVVFKYNSLHDWFNPYFGAFGTSFACCYNGVSTPYLDVSSNIILFNVGPTNDVRYGYGTEGMGKGATYRNNMIQAANYTINNSFPPGPGIVYGCGPVASMSNNTVQGGFHGSYVVSEGNLPCGTVTQPVTFTGNVTGVTTTVATSVAPTISPAGGAYTSPPTVTLTDAGFSSGSVPLGNTSIWYTTDGSTPVPGSGSARLYTAPFRLTLPVTVKAVGMWGVANQPTSYPSGFGFAPSAVQSASYTSTGGITLSSVALSNVGAVHSLINGSSIQMNAVCTYSDASTTSCNTPDTYGNGVSSWASNNAAVTISSSGLATGAAVGSANLTATVAGLTTPTWAMAVTPATISLSSVSLATTGGVTSLVAGGVNQLKATCTYSDSSTTDCTQADAHGNDATFASTAPTVATVDGNGVLSAAAAGGTSLSAAVQAGMVTSRWGQTAENTTGHTGAGYINSTYFVFGNQPGGYAGAGATCSFYLPTGTLVNGSLFDCGLIPAPTPTTQASSWLCYGTYTVSGTSAPNAFVTVPMTGCPASIATGSAEWVAVATNASGNPNVGFSDCGGSGCSGSAPTLGNGTYACRYVAVPYGTRSGMPTAMIAGCGPGTTYQTSQYVTMGQPPITSNTVPITVTASGPTLVSAYLAPAGGANTMTVGGTLQFAAKCVYSDSSTTDCTVADIHGNAVTAWSTTDATKVAIGAVSGSNPGLATAVAQGSASVQAAIGSLASSTYALTVSSPAVALTGISLATTGGITGLFVGSTNALVATCDYSDGSSTNCTTTDSHGNLAARYTSSTPSHATVNAGTGVVTGAAPGTTTLSAGAGSFTSMAIPLTVLAVPSGTYYITITGPVSFSGKVQF